MQVFLGFVNFYRRFIEGYSHITRPLTDLLKSVDHSVGTPAAVQSQSRSRKTFDNEGSAHQWQEAMAVDGTSEGSARRRQETATVDGTSNLPTDLLRGMDMLGTHA